MHEIPDADNGVLLRPWQPANAPVVLAAAAEPLMDRQFGAAMETLEAAVAWIAACAADRAADTAYSFAVLDKRGAPVGNVAVSNVERSHLTYS